MLQSQWSPWHWFASPYIAETLYLYICNDTKLNWTIMMHLLSLHNLVAQLCPCFGQHVSSPLLYWTRIKVALEAFTLKHFLPHVLHCVAFSGPIMFNMEKKCNQMNIQHWLGSHHMVVNTYYWTYPLLEQNIHCLV